MIYVECKADLLLIRMVASISLRDIIHEGGKSEVLRRLEKQSKAVGLIDEDPWAFQPPLLKRYSVERSFEEDGIRVLRRRGKVLIVLCPRLEEWTLEAARKSGIDVVREYGLPNRGDKLHREINLNLVKFERLLKKLIEQGARRVGRLKELVIGLVKEVSP